MSEFKCEGVVAYSWNPITWKAEVIGRKFHGHLGYIVKPFLEKKQTDRGQVWHVCVHTVQITYIIVCVYDVCTCLRGDLYTERKKDQQTCRILF